MATNVDDYHTHCREPKELDDRPQASIVDAERYNKSAEASDISNKTRCLWRSASGLIGRHDKHGNRAGSNLGKIARRKILQV